MKNTRLSDTLQQEITAFIDSRKTLQLATLSPQGEPCASYAPFGIGDGCLYLLISDLAAHTLNLKTHPVASVLLVEDEAATEDVFARVRLNYSVQVQLINREEAGREDIIAAMAQRLGQRVNELNELADFRLFRLTPTQGRYVKGFGRAYGITGASLTGTSLDHLRYGNGELQ